MKVSASFLSKNYKPEYLIKEYNQTNVDYIHVDIMDGKFVKEKSYTISEVIKLSNIITKPLDVHLMVNNPIKYVEKLATLNIEYMTFHFESVKDVRKTIEIIKNYGFKVGISINPKTSVKEILPYLSELSSVLIMSVEPGKSGQVFKDSVLYKIQILKKVILENNYKAIICVDGGINEETARLVKDAKADMVVSASFLEKDIKKNTELLKNI